jgi:hypothetical protein
LKPVLHPSAPAVEMVMDRADTAPVVSAVPRALAHLPTARSVAAADSLWVKTVVGRRVTETAEDFLVVRLVSVIVTSEPLTAVTEPDAAANWPVNRPRAPDPAAGREPPDVEPGNSPALAGRPDPPPGNPPWPLADPCPPPPNPPVQAPEVDGVMLTVVAVTGPPNAEVLDDEVGFPTAEMHEPTVTPDAVVVTVWSNVVAEE